MIRNCCESRPLAKEFQVKQSFIVNPTLYTQSVQLDEMSSSWVEVTKCRNKNKISSQ